MFFRTMLFKIFNRIDTWEAIEGKLGPLEWNGIDLAKVDRALEALRSHGRKIYSAAYIMPSPALYLGCSRPSPRSLNCLIILFVTASTTVTSPSSLLAA